MDNSSVNALTVYNGNLIAGGEFANAGGIPANYIADWSGSSWSALSTGMGNSFPPPAPPYVYALTVYGDKLIAGGWFNTAGGIAANFVAQWDGTSWSALGGGIGDPGCPVCPFVRALTVYPIPNGNLIVGGNFASAGGTEAHSIAQWNGASWSSLGTGIGGAVYALAIYNGNLIAGGGFATAGGTVANNIARWDGTSWSALGTGISGDSECPVCDSVLALTVYNGDLIVGGWFSTAGGTAANNIAKWNDITSSWSALGSGMGGTNSMVNGLAVYDGNLIAGGSFTTAGGTAVYFIAQWDATSWSALGNGVTSTVNALTVYNDKLIAGGVFAGALFAGGGIQANNIAAWSSP
jgi:hypothetical protein